VGYVFKADRHWLFMIDFILERNRLNVVFAADDLHGLEVVLHTAESTVEKNHTNHTNVTCVTRPFVGLNI